MEMAAVSGLDSQSSSSFTLPYELVDTVISELHPPQAPPNITTPASTPASDLPPVPDRELVMPTTDAEAQSRAETDSAGQLPGAGRQAGTERELSTIPEHDERVEIQHEPQHFESLIEQVLPAACVHAT